MPSRSRSRRGGVTASRATPVRGSPLRHAIARRSPAPGQRGSRQAAGGRRLVVPGPPARLGRQRGRGRPLAADLHVLPSGVVGRGASRAHVAHARRTDDCRDRTRVPRARTDHGATTGAGQAQDPQRRHSVPRSSGAPAAGAHGCRARRALPVVQRGLLAHRRYRPRSPSRERRGDPPRAHARAADARRAGSRRPPRAAAPAGRARAGARRRPRATSSPSTSRTARAGTATRSGRDSTTSTPRCDGAPGCRIRCKRRSPRVTRPRRRRPRPTGRRSRRYTASSRGTSRRRSSS